MFKRLISNFIARHEIYKKAEHDAINYHNLWQTQKDEIQKLKEKLKFSIEENYQKLDIIRRIYEIIKKADKRNKVLKEINKICKEILK